MFLVELSSSSDTQSKRVAMNYVESFLLYQILDLLNINIIRDKRSENQTSLIFYLGRVLSENQIGLQQSQRQSKLSSCHFTSSDRSVQVLAFLVQCGSSTRNHNDDELTHTCGACVRPPGSIHTHTYVHVCARARRRFDRAARAAGGGAR